MLKIKKVYILGSEGTGWSIDKDREYIIKAIESIDGFEVINNIFIADIIYAIWWDKLMTKQFILFNFFFKKKVIATITSDLSHQETKIKSIIGIVDRFVYSNSKQESKLLELGIDNDLLYFNPFYVDENIFKKMNMTKKELCNRFNLNYERLKDKKLIGSFQRDSLGADLSKPKWQKDPDMLISILKKLDLDKFTLILAGPRRHYIVNKCIKYNIDYIFIGDERYIKNNEDDIKENSLSIHDMPYLYNLVDLYIVSSKSEGGPKAIPESVLCNTYILSTDVGFAKNLLNSELIYYNSEEAIKKINKFDINMVDKSYVYKYYNFKLFKERIFNILKGLSL